MLNRMRYDRPRDAAITRAVLSGQTFETVGSQYGISGSAANQAFRKVLRDCLRSITRVDSEDAPKGPRTLQGCRDNKESWMPLIKKWEEVGSWEPKRRKRKLQADPSSEELVQREVVLTSAQWAKVDANGIEWLRGLIQRAKSPTSPPTETRP